MRKSAVFLLLLLLSACATFRMKHTYPLHDTPFYHGRGAQGTGDVIFFPVEVDGRAGGEVAAAMGEALPGFLGEMDAYLETLKLGRKAVPPAEDVPEKKGRWTVTPPKQGPAVYVNSTELLSDKAHPAERPDELALRRRSPLAMELWEPSKNHRERLRQVADREQASFMIIIRLQAADFVPTLKKWKFGVPLGTGYRAKVPLRLFDEKTVPVFQLSGILLDHRGNVVKAGVEGFLAGRTDPATGVLSWLVCDEKSDCRIRSVVSAEEALKMSEARRMDLPGQPLAWQAAMRNLVGQLLDRGELVD